MFTLNEVVPFGRSFDEYRRMFALSADDLRRRTLGCADGPASFNAEATQQGCHVVSCDPLYFSDAGTIRTRIAASFEQVMEQARQNREQFVWDEIRSIEELGRLRLSTMNVFLEDLERGKEEGRYIAAELPSLPFADGSFDLGLCSHFLFLYSNHLTAEFHFAAIYEMCRVAAEVRIFPLFMLAGRESPHLDPIIHGLKQAGLAATVEDVPYEFQRGARSMLRVCRTEC